MRPRTTRLLVLIIAAIGSTVHAAWIPDLAVAGRFGVNIKSTGQAEDWLNKYDTASVKVLRFDMYWSEVEKSPGVYTFATPPNSGQYNYDWLMPQTNARGITMMCILQGSCTFHDSGYGPYSAEGTAAFASFAAACVAKYKGNSPPVIWELLNEPGDGAWSKKPGSSGTADEQAAAVIKAAAPAMRAADPNAIILGPAFATHDAGTDSFPASVLSQARTFAGLGALQLLDALTIHPYRQTSPETAIGPMQHFRAMLKTEFSISLPLLVGELGYSSFYTYGAPDGEGAPTGAYPQLTDAQLGAYCVRSYLVSLMLGSDLFVWYKDWKGGDVANTEDMYGFLGTKTYDAAVVFNSTLRGYEFGARSAIGSAGEFLLTFTKGDSTAIVAWTTARQNGQSAQVPVILPLRNAWRSVTLYGTTGTVTGNGAASVTIDQYPRMLLGRTADYGNPTPAGLPPTGPMGRRVAGPCSRYDIRGRSIAERPHGVRGVTLVRQQDRGRHQVVGGLTGDSR